MDGKKGAFHHYHLFKVLSQAGDFISMLTESDQEFAEEYMEKKNIEVLDAILDSYDINTKDIYNTWKKNSGFLKVRNFEVKHKVTIMIYCSGSFTYNSGTSTCSRR